MGPKTALKLIKEHSTIENVIEHMRKDKEAKSKEFVYDADPTQFNFEDARVLFKNASVIDTEGLELKWKDPNEEELIQILVNENQFNPDRVKNNIEKLKKYEKNKKQMKVTDFFKRNDEKIISSTTVTNNKNAKNKRKAGDQGLKDNKKKGK